MVYNIEKIKSELLHLLVVDIFNNLKKHMDAGDLIFTGGLVHDRVGIFKKDNFHDLDISIIKGEYGDNILYELKEHLLNLDLTKFENKLSTKINKRFKIKEENNQIRGLFFIDDIFGIDIYRDEYPKDNMTTVEIYPNIYTKYYGHEWILRETFSTYKYMLSLNSNRIKKRRIDKIEKTLVDIFNKVDEFNDIQLYDDIIRIKEIDDDVDLNTMNLNAVSNSRSGHNFVMNNIKSWIKDINYNYTNIENTKLNEFKFNINKHNISDNSVNVLIIRDYLNWLASYLPVMKVNLINYQDGYDDSVIINETNEQIKIWCEHVKEFYGETNFVPNKINVDYDEFFSSPNYRKDICTKLNGEYNETELNEITINGYYSSFDLDKFDGNAQKMKVDERYLEILNTEYHDVYIKLILNNQEALDLYLKYFNPSKVKKDFINKLKNIKLKENKIEFKLKTPYELGLNNTLKFGDLRHNKYILNSNELYEKHKEFDDSYKEFIKNQEIKKKELLLPYIEISNTLGQDTNYIIANIRCGGNKLSELRPNDNVIGIDYYPINDDVIVCDITNIPLEDNSVDVVVLSLINVNNILDVIKEAHRILKNDGILMIAELKNISKIIKIELINVGFYNLTTYIKGNYIYYNAKKKNNL